MANATENALGELHGIVATKMKADLEKGEYSAAYLAVVVKFLKDNGIEATEDDEKLTGLKEKAGNVLQFPFDPEANAA